MTSLETEKEERKSLKPKRNSPIPHTSARAVELGHLGAGPLSVPLLVAILGPVGGEPRPQLVPEEGRHEPRQQGRGRRRRDKVPGRDRGRQEEGGRARGEVRAEVDEAVAAAVEGEGLSLVLYEL